MAKANEVLIYIKDKMSVGGLKSLPGMVDGVTQRIKGAFTALAIGAVAALTTAMWQLTKSVKEFATQELGETDLKSAMKQMGVYTDQYRDKLVALANQYQETTNIGDEVWLKTFGTLTRFGATADNIERVAEATKNLAALMDGNLQGATLAMQRAIEGEFSMFSRYGIKLDLTGDKIKDLDALMTKLAEKGGGALEARAQTLSGRFSALQNAVTDFREEIGRTLSESLGLKEGFDSLILKFNEWKESAKTGKIHEIVKGAAERIRDFADTIVEIVERINSLQDLKLMAETIGDWLKAKLIEGGHEVAAYLTEKAPIIGNAIGEAVRATLTNSLGDLRAATKKTRQDFGSPSGMPRSIRTELSAAFREALKENKAQIRLDRAMETGKQFREKVDISPESATDFWSIYGRNQYEADKAAAISEVINMAASGMSTEEIDGVIRSWELTQEEITILMDAMGSSAESATEATEAAEATAKASTDMQAATTKSLDATTQSNAALKVAMETSTTAAQQSMQVAQQSASVLDQVMDHQAQLLSIVQRQQGYIDALGFEIQNLKA